MSATALAEYLILRPDQQETVLHDSRFSRPPIVSAYADAARALIAYNVNPSRPPETLDLVKKALTAKSVAPNLRPKAREEALRCIEIIDLFRLTENALGLRSLPLSEAPRFDEMEIEGVGLSVQPHFLVQTVPQKGKAKIGAVMLRLAKAPDPAAFRTEPTRAAKGEIRREMARYLIAMMQMLLEEQAADRGEIDPDLIFVADIRLGEKIGAASNQSARLRAVRSGCNQIARLWDTIMPRASILRKPD